MALYDEPREGPDPTNPNVAASSYLLGSTLVPIILAAAIAVLLAAVFMPTTPRVADRTNAGPSVRTVEPTPVPSTSPAVPTPTPRTQPPTP
jgi:hypothetical protein